MAVSGSLEGGTAVVRDLSNGRPLFVLAGDLLKYDCESEDDLLVKRRQDADIPSQVSSLVISPDSTTRSGTIAFTSDDKDTCSYTLKLCESLSCPFLEITH